MVARPWLTAGTPPPVKAESYAQEFEKDAIAHYLQHRLRRSPTQRVLVQPASLSQWLARGVKNLLGFARQSSIPSGSHCFDPRHWPPSGLHTLGSSYPRRFPERDLRCSTLSGRSERASYLPSVLARKTESGLPLVTTLAGDGFFLYRVWSP